jgi:hypothetical protein
MSGIIDEAGEEYFEDLFNVIEKHPDWEYSGPESRSEAPEYSKEALDQGARNEVRFSHTDTDGVLLLGIPDVGTGDYAVSGSLAQSLTTAEMRDDEFLNELLNANQEIARRNTADEEYVGDHRDMARIASVSVPFDYDEEKLLSGLEALSDTSREVAEMHEEVYGVLDRFTDA